MARKNVINPVRVITSETIDADITSIETDIQHLDCVSYLVNYSDLTGTGTFKVQCSTWNGLPVETRLWADLDLDPVAVDSSVSPSGTFVFNLYSLATEKIRLTFTKGTASAGTLDAWLMAKTVGA